jgi:hypothetical protein
VVAVLLVVVGPVGPTTTNTHSEYVILIAFPRQQWLCERAPMLRYMYIACLVKPYEDTKEAKGESSKYLEHFPP